MKQCMKRTFVTSVAIAVALDVRISKTNSGTLSTNTNGTNRVLGLGYQSIRVTAETDRLGSSDLDRFHPKNVAEIGEFKNSV